MPTTPFVNAGLPPGLEHEVEQRLCRTPEPGQPARGDDIADPQVLVDRDRAAQAIDNLLTNALGHAKAHVNLSAHSTGQFVELHVSDDGPGFLPHAWERFARADTARTENGAGLGLAIVRTIAEAHGGRALGSKRDNRRR